MVTERNMDCFEMNFGFTGYTNIHIIYDVMHSFLAEMIYARRLKDFMHIVMLDL